MEGRTVIEPCPHTLHFLGFHTGLGYVIPCHTAIQQHCSPGLRLGPKQRLYKICSLGSPFFFFCPQGKTPRQRPGGRPQHSRALPPAGGSLLPHGPAATGCAGTGGDTGPAGSTPGAPCVVHGAPLQAGVQHPRMQHPHTSHPQPVPQLRLLAKEFASSPAKGSKQHCQAKLRGCSPSRHPDTHFSRHRACTHSISNAEMQASRQAPHPPLQGFPAILPQLSPGHAKPSKCFMIVKTILSGKPCFSSPPCSLICLVPLSSLVRKRRVSAG